MRKIILSLAMLLAAPLAFLSVCGLALSGGDWPESITFGGAG